MAVAFFGDGAVAQGAFHEAVNLAAVMALRDAGALQYGVVRGVAVDVEQLVVQRLVELAQAVLVRVDDDEARPGDAQLAHDVATRGADATDDDVVVEMVNCAFHASPTEQPLQIDDEVEPLAP